MVKPKPKTETTKKQRGEAGSPSKILAGGILSGPGKTLAGAARPHQRSEPPPSPRVPTQPTTLELGLGRHCYLLITTLVFP